MKQLSKLQRIMVFAVIVVFTAATMVADDESQSNAVACPIEVSTDIVNGTITVDKTEAVAGETVTITVTPDYGYAATSEDVNIELTIDPGISRAPSRESHKAPALGDVIHPESDVRATNDTPATYTFTMPDYPYSVFISVNFTKLSIYRVVWVMDQTGHTLWLSTSQGTYMGGGIPEGTLVTATFTMKHPEDFFVEGLSVVDEKTHEEHIVEVIKKSDTIYTFTMPAFDVFVRGIEKAYLHGVRFDANNHWATYYGNRPLEIPDGVQGYVVTAVTDTEVQLELLSDDDNQPFIPWKMGVLLYSEIPMDEVFTNASSRASWDYTSMLKGSLEDTEITSGYVLYEDKFIRSRAGTLPAHRCYLPMEVAPASAPRELKIVRPGEAGVVTGIESVKSADVADTKYISMTGMTSDKPFSGVNVMVITRTDGTTETRKVVK